VKSDASPISFMDPAENLYWPRNAGCSRNWRACDLDGELMTDPIITENCIRGDLTLETYHQQICAGPSFSSSNLRDCELRSPSHAYAGWSGNPDREPESTKALSFGSAAHALVLGDEAFSVRHVVMPFNDYARIETIDGVTWKPRPAAKDSEIDVSTGALRYKSLWRDDMLRQGKSIVSQDDLRHIRNMAEVVATDPRLDCVFAGDVEQSCFWKDEQTGLWLKSRLDVRPLDDTLVDFKTTPNASPRKCEYAITTYGYDMQFALGAEGLLVAAGQKIYAHMAIFQEKEPPYAVTPVEIGAQAIWRSAQRNRRALDTLAMCLERNEWPGYAMPAPYQQPEWLENRLQKEEDGGLLTPAPAWLEELKQDRGPAPDADYDMEIDLS